MAEAGRGPLPLRRRPAQRASPALPRPTQPTTPAGVSKLLSGQVDNEWLDVLDDGNVLSHEQARACGHVGWSVSVRVLAPPPAAPPGPCGLNPNWRQPAASLSPPQVASGYILPCSAKPLSDLVVEVNSDWGVHTLDQWKQHARA